MYLSYLDNLKLDLIVSFSNTATDGLNNSINEFSRKSAIVLRWGRIFRIEAIIITVSIQKLIGYQLLDDVQNMLH